MSCSRVFITGLGAVTACGATAEESWQAVLEGKSGIHPIKQWDLTSWPTRLGGEIKDFQPARMLPDRKLLKVISRQDVMGINAAIQAITQSEMIPYRDNLEDATSFNENTAIYVGSPGNKYFQQYDFLPLLAKAQGNMQTFAEHLFNEVHPMWLLRILPNNVLAYTGITYGFKGPNHNITNHAVSGMQALIEAYHAIKQGYAERAVVIAYDMGIEPQALYYYEKLGLISEQHLKPFDKEHDGTILGEGAAAFILESEASLAARGAKAYGEILGGGCATEGTNLFSIEEDGKALQNLLAQTLQAADLTAKEIDFVVAHGNGNKKSDETEAMAIQAVFPNVPVSAFKWAMGHTICASGMIDTVLANYALNQQILPGIANLTSVAKSCLGLNARSEHRSLRSQSCALLINRGFAGMNACIVMKAGE